MLVNNHFSCYFDRFCISECIGYIFLHTRVSSMTRKRYSVTCDLCLQSSIPPAWCGRMSWYFIAFQETCNTFGFHTICIQNHLYHICSFQSLNEQLQGDDTLFQWTNNVTCMAEKTVSPSTYTSGLTQT